MSQTPIKSSPSRTYVILTHSDHFDSISFKQFTLPEKVENNCSNATWYFYNRLDGFSCGESAYPIEIHNSIETIG